MTVPARPARARRTFLPIRRAIPAARPAALEPLEQRKLLASIGYYDVFFGQGTAADAALLEDPLVNHDAVLLDALTPAALSGLDGLVVTAHSGGIAAGTEWLINTGVPTLDEPDVFEYVDALPAIEQFVADGGTLIIHDMKGANTVTLSNASTRAALPGSPAISLGRSFFGNSSRSALDLSEAPATLINGPAGTLTNAGYSYASLVGSSSAGQWYFTWANRTTLPSGVDVLTSGAGAVFNEIVSFEYGHGAGTVIWTGMHRNGDFAATNATRRNYEINLIAHAFGVVALNSPPVAVITTPAGGYSVTEGDALLLDASTSSDPDFDALTYAWDLDNDGQFDDAAGATPSISWAALNALGVNGGTGSFSARVRVSDGTLSAVSGPVSVAVVNAAPAPAFTTFPAAPAEGQSLGFAFAGNDPGGEAGLSYAWSISLEGDVVASGAGSSFSFMPADDGSYDVTITATDAFGLPGSTTQALAVANLAPTWTAADTSGQAQFSDALPALAFSAADAGNDPLDAAVVSGLPAGSGLALAWNGGTNSGTLSGTAALVPGTYNLVVRVSEVGNASAFSDTPVTLTITPEDASAAYSGLFHVSTPAVAITSAASANLSLRVTVADVLDGSPAGSLAGATVVFRDASNAVIGTAPLVAVANDDPSAPVTAVATLPYTAILAAGDDSRLFDFFYEVQGTHALASSGIVTVAVSRPEAGRVSVGGSIASSGASAGLLATDAGMETLIAFTARRKKDGSMSGDLSLTIPSYNLPDGTRDTVLHRYAIRSTQISSLEIFSSGGMLRAAVSASVDVVDVTNPLVPVTIATGLTLETTLTDGGTAQQSLGYTLWGPTSASSSPSLWFANNWNGLSNEEEQLFTGKVKIDDK